MHHVSQAFLDAIRASHTVELRVDAYRGSELLAERLPVSDGAVNIDGNSQIRRTASLTIADPTLDPGNDPLAPLAPYGSDITIKRGVRFPNGVVEWVDLGVFRVEACSTAASGEAVQVTGSDRAAYVHDAHFTAMRKSNTSLTVPEQIAALITEVLTVDVEDRTSSIDVPPTVYWEQNRWEAIEGLAESIGAVVFFAPDGHAVIAPVPSIDDPAAWWVDAGETGVMLEASMETTREGTYNAVVASGESGGQFLPYTATVTDDDPDSPTYWGGSFGRKPYFYTSPLITTQSQATKTATAMLDKVRGMSRQLALTSVVNPALEAGDVIRVRFPDSSTERHLVDALDIPLDPGSSMSITTRSPDPTQE